MMVSLTKTIHFLFIQYHVLDENLFFQVNWKLTSSVLGGKNDPAATGLLLMGEILVVISFILIIMVGEAPRSISSILVEKRCSSPAGISYRMFQSVTSLIPLPQQV